MLLSRVDTGSLSRSGADRELRDLEVEGQIEN